MLTTSPQLDALQTRKYRSVVMRAAYLSQDRPDLSYLKKESGDTNVSDALTKTLDEKRMLNLLTMMGYEFREGRTFMAPEAQ